MLELTYNYGVDSYDLGEGFGYFGIAVPDVHKKVEAIKEAGGKVGLFPEPHVLVMCDAPNNLRPLWKTNRAFTSDCQCFVSFSPSTSPFDNVY